MASTRIIIVIYIVSLLSIVHGYYIKSGSHMYPISRHTMMDPGSYDLLYAGEKSPFNETWAFSEEVTLTGLIVPSQIIDKNGLGVYDEHITLRVFKHQKSSGITTEVGRGAFRDKAKFGQEIYIPIVDPTTDLPPVMVEEEYNADTSYRMEFTLSPGGFYPWYTANRLFSTTGVIRPVVDDPGYCIGVEYSLH